MWRQTHWNRKGSRHENRSAGSQSYPLGELYRLCGEDGRNSAGGLLIALPKAGARMFLQQFDHVDAAVIGRVVTEGKGEIVVK